MTWDDIKLRAAFIRDYTGEKLQTLRTATELRMQLAAVRKQLTKLYQEFGENAYTYFCSEQDGVDILSDYVEKITVLKEHEADILKQLEEENRKEAIAEPAEEPETEEK